MTARTLLLPLALLAGCAPPAGDAVTLTVADSAGVRIARIDADPAELAEWTLAPTPRWVITGAESGDSAAFAPVGGALWLAGGDLVIADLGANRLLVYDSTGVFRQALGRAGDGPGEFRRIGALSQAGGDTVAVFDGTHRTLSYLHTGTGYARQVSVSEGASLEAWPADAWAAREGQVVVLQLAVTPRDSLPEGSGARRWPMRAHLTLRDATGAVRAVSRGFAGMYTALTPDGGDRRVAFSNRPFAAVGRDRVYYGSGQAFALSTLTMHFDTPGEIRWPAVEEPITAQELAALREELAATLGARVPAARLPGVLDREFAPELLPASRPAIGRVFEDPDERVWVERFEPVRLGTATQAPGALWHVLAPDGRPLARLRLPPRTRLEAVRDGHALVVQRDDLDVETVAAYAITR